MGKIYISGCITGTDNPSPEVVKERLAKFAKVADLLPYARALVVNPVEVSACSAEDSWCSGAENDEHDWACYMRFDIIALMSCDRIVMLEGWQESRGARLELHIAEQLGMAVSFWNDSIGSLQEAPVLR